MHYIITPNPAVAGEEQNPAIVLLHGTPKNSYYWHKLTPLLTPHFTAVAPDFARLQLHRQATYYRWL